MGIQPTVVGDVSTLAHFGYLIDILTNVGLKFGHSNFSFKNIQNLPTFGKIRIFKYCKTPQYRPLEYRVLPNTVPQFFPLYFWCTVKKTIPHPPPPPPPLIYLIYLNTVPFCGRLEQSLPPSVDGGRGENSTVDGGRWKGRYRRRWPVGRTVSSTIAGGKNGGKDGGRWQLSFFLRRWQFFNG